jgi:hypothetical protein
MAKSRFTKGNQYGKATQFKPGNQASKGHGRPPKLPKLDEYLAKILGEEMQTKTAGNDAIVAIEIILKALRLKAAKGDVKAATLLLERAYGKPKQFIEQVNRNEVDLSSLSNDELFLVKKIQEKNNPNDATGQDAGDTV